MNQSAITVDISSFGFKKRQFQSPLEAAYFLMGLQLKHDTEYTDSLIQEGLHDIENGDYILLPKNASKQEISSALRN